MFPTRLSTIAAWSLMVLGIAHIVFGRVKFREPLLEAIQAGGMGHFNKPEIRRKDDWT